VRDSQIPIDGTPVPDEDIITHSLSADAIPIPTAPAVTPSVLASTLPSRIIIPEQTNYLTPFISRQSKKMLLLFLLL
jgi:hypothetical protein